MERKSQSGITQEIIDYAHELKKRNPNMYHKEIAAYLFGEGLTQKRYSHATIGSILKVHTIDEYLDLPHIAKSRHKKELVENTVTVDDQNAEQENAENEVTAEEQVSDTTVAEDDPENIDKEPEPNDEFFDHMAEKQLVPNISNLFEKYLLCVGTGGYPDVPIAEKTQSIAAGIACVKKTLNLLYVNIKAESEAAQQEHACVLESIDNIKVNTQYLLTETKEINESLKASERMQENIFNCLSSVECDITELNDNISETNELLKHFVSLWDTPESNCANL